MALTDSEVDYHYKALVVAVHEAKNRLHETCRELIAKKLELAQKKLKHAKLVQLTKSVAWQGAADGGNVVGMARQGAPDGENVVGIVRTDGINQSPKD